MSGRSGFGGRADQVERPQAIAITGPTAVGKSAVAELVAMELGVPVLSADAMQVYRGMDIGTAKIPSEKRRVPLLLIDLVDITEPYSAALYQRDAREQIDALLGQGRVPVLCGGTGLYLRAALDRMEFPAGEVGDERRQAYQRIADEQGPTALHALLEERDPESAALIHPNNVKRVVRALEMHDEGASYAEQARGFSAPEPYYRHLTFALTMDREQLYRRIDARVDAMMEAGLVDEVCGLVDAGARDALTSRQAIGYKEIIQALDGEISMDEAVALIKQRSRRYAKRQLSWCRRDGRMVWMSMDGRDEHDAAHEIVERAGL